jgi:hypothetical protein
VLLDNHDDSVTWKKDIDVSPIFRGESNRRVDVKIRVDGKGLRGRGK